MKTYKLIYLADGGLRTLEYTDRFARDYHFYEVGGKERLMTTVGDGCYERLMHVCKDGRHRTVGQYPSFTLGRDWSESLQEKYKEALAEVRGETVYNEETYNKAVDAMAEQVVAMVQEDYPGDVEMQRGEAGNYLGTAIEDIQTNIDNLLD